MTVECLSPAEDNLGTTAPRRLDLRQRILVVDDERLILRLNSNILKCAGYQADIAEDGAAAWDALQLNRYDLMVTDNDMPKVSGMELLRKIFAASMALPTIMVTGKFPAKEFACNPWLRPDATLLKPYTVHELVGAVKNVLQATFAAPDLKAPPPDWQSRPLSNPCGRNDASRPPHESQRAARGVHAASTSHGARTSHIEAA